VGEPARKLAQYEHAIGSAGRCEVLHYLAGVTQASQLSESY
jgi:hypothetical protein